MHKALIALTGAMALLALPARAAEGDAAIVERAGAGLKLCDAQALDAKAVEAQALAAGWSAFEDLGPDTLYQRMSVRHDPADPSKVLLALGLGEIAPTPDEPLHLFTCMVAVQWTLLPPLLDQVTEVFGQPIGRTEGASLWLKRKAGAVRALDLTEMQALSDAPQIKLAPDEQLIEVKESLEGRIGTVHVRIFEAPKGVAK